jgi:predicted RNA-binding Zn-ribbon protein involved in translation (DUF1610 family)
MSETTKKKRERSTYYGGLEGILDSSGFVVFLIGLLAGIWVLVIAGSTGILLAVTIWTVAFVVRLVLRALAECIRLQKKGVGLPYGGKISKAQETVIYTCSECGAMLHTDSRCESCGRPIDGSA